MMTTGSNSWSPDTFQPKMSDGRIGAKMPLKPALKRNYRQQQQLQSQQQLQQQSQLLAKTTTKPFQVPEGLRSLLNDITKEVTAFPRIETLQK